MLDKERSGPARQCILEWLVRANRVQRGEQRERAERLTVLAQGEQMLHVGGAGAIASTNLFCLTDDLVDVALELGRLMGIYTAQPLVVLVGLE